MEFKSIVMTATVLAAAIAAGPAGANAQGPLYDKVIVDLPYSVTIGNTSLKPGHYVIRQLDTVSGGSRVLQIFSNEGMKLETTSLTIPTLDNNTPSDTKVVLHHFGNDYYFDKIWIQGKDYGYEFPLPPAVKARSKEALQPYTVAATYESTKTPEPVQTAAVAPPPAPAPAPEPTPAPVAAAEPAPAPAPEPTPAPEMPHTAANWLGMMLSGGMLSGAGMMLRRLRS